jgi:hypothetical protein
MRADLGLAPRTVDAYGRGPAEYLAFCAAQSVSVVDAGRDHVARFVRGDCRNFRVRAGFIIPA